MIGGNAQISGEEKKDSENQPKEGENPVKNEDNTNNEKKEEEKKEEENKEEKPKKKTAFSFIKKKGKTSNKDISNLSNSNDNVNINNKSPTNDDDLSKLMKATSSSQNSNFFEELNKMSNLTANNINKNELNNNTNSNINNLKDNNNDIPKQKGGFGGFGFIKRGDKNPSKDEISLQSTITHPNPNEANNTTKIIEKPKKKKSQFIRTI